MGVDGSGQEGEGWVKYRGDRMGVRWGAPGRKGRGAEGNKRT